MTRTGNSGRRILAAMMTSSMLISCAAYTKNDSAANYRGPVTEQNYRPHIPPVNETKPNNPKRTNLPWYD